MDIGLTVAVIAAVVRESQSIEKELPVAKMPLKLGYGSVSGKEHPRSRIQ